MPQSTGSCERCHVADRHPKSSYCRECKNALQRHYAAQRRQGVPARGDRIVDTSDSRTFFCGKCGLEKSASEFYRRNGSVSTAWCKECYRLWHQKRYATKDSADDSFRNCAECGASYRPKQRRASIYCSRKCKWVAKNAKVAEELLASKQERQCLHCGGVIPQSASTRVIFCSEQCNSKAHGLQRKLRMRAGQDDKPGYLRLTICERDNWICGICGELVDRKLEHPDPMCASLDHVVPVSLGGGSEPSNLRLTHLVCNLRRRNTPLSDVELFKWLIHV